MSKAMRQMPGRPGRVGVARGEAVRDLISDEADGPLREHTARQRLRALPKPLYCRPLKTSNGRLRRRLRSGGVSPLIRAARHDNLKRRSPDLIAFAGGGVGGFLLCIGVRR
jgi:hypothetical protein